MRYRICWLGLLFLFQSGCDSTVVVDTSEAERVAEEYFQQVRVGNLDRAISLYSERFFQNTDRVQWRNKLELVKNALGDLETFELRATHQRTFTDRSTSNTCIVLVYSVKYSKYPALETINVCLASAPQVPAIDGHDIRSDGLITAPEKE
jgi:hypothetical protein